MFVGLTPLQRNYEKNLRIFSDTNFYRSCNAKREKNEEKHKEFCISVPCRPNTSVRSEKKTLRILCCRHSHRRIFFKEKTLKMLRMLLLEEVIVVLRVQTNLRWKRSSSKTLKLCKKISMTFLWHKNVEAVIAVESTILYKTMIFDQWVSEKLSQDWLEKERKRKRNTVSPILFLPRNIINILFKNLVS